MDAHEPVNILMVDDHPGKLLTYEVMLRDLGENLIKAASGREALEHLLKTVIAGADTGLVWLDPLTSITRGCEAVVPSTVLH